jgi:hypothetical protein
MAAAAVQVGTRRDTRSTTELGGELRRAEGRVDGWAWLRRWIVWDSVGRWPTFQPKFLKEEAKVYNGFQSRVERALNKSSSTFSSITSELVESEKDKESQVISIMQGMIQVATMLDHSAATNTRL